MPRILLVPALLTNLTACMAHQAAGQPPVPRTEAAAPAREDAEPGEMVDIRATLKIEVESVSSAALKLRAMAQESAAQVVADNTTASSVAETGSFDLRVPAAKTKAFLDSLGGLGRILERKVMEADVSKEFHDSEIFLRNMQATLRRYEELLAKATDVKDMLAIEAELGRIRGQIDRVTGERKWLEDRVARSTIHVELIPKQPELAHEPQAKFYPGLKASYFAGMGASRFSYAGAGASIQFGRRGSIDLDVLKWTRSSDSLLNGADMMLLTIGGEAYSDFLGGGKRRFLNPYLGSRIGYGRNFGSSAFVLGATVGLEIVRVKYLVVDVQEQAIGLIGGKLNTSFGFQTSLTARVVF